MTVTGLTQPDRMMLYRRMTGRAMMMAITLSAALGGCINVTAPDKPIEINLNINVTQEVVYRLDGEAKSLIKQNPGIF
jgi:hypothetical protein